MATFTIVKLQRRSKYSRIRKYILLYVEIVTPECCRSRFAIASLTGEASKKHVAAAWLIIERKKTRLVAAHIGTPVLTAAVVYIRLNIGNRETHFERHSTTFDDFDKKRTRATMSVGKKHGDKPTAAETRDAGYE